MYQTLCAQSDWSLVQKMAMSVSAMGIVLCAVSSAYAFSVGTLPGLNCDTFVPPVPCQLAPRLSQYEEVHQTITDNALRPVTFTPPSGAAVPFSPQALKDIRDGNAGTDYLQGLHELHFDNAYLEEGAKHVQAITKLLHHDLSETSTMSVARAKVIRERFGSILHTIQDFYAHSNYVNILPLNSSQQFWDPPAVHAQLPFSNPCDTVLVKFSPLIGNIYDTPLDPITGHQILTSGYADSLVRGIAPLGQCAHGLLGNGIHKDWTGRDGHDVARGVATLATTRFAEDIIKYPSNNPNNVCMLMTDKPCRTSSNPWVGTWGGTYSWCELGNNFQGTFELTQISGTASAGTLSMTYIDPTDPRVFFLGPFAPLYYSGNSAHHLNQDWTYELSGNTIKFLLLGSCASGEFTRQ